MGNQTGLFVVLEGMDGSGKSTHLAYLQRLFEAKGRSVRLTREPGGSEFAEVIRQQVLFAPMGPWTEMLAVAAARRDHLEKTIWPALARNEVVLCDRFSDSTWAYQVRGRGLPEAAALSLESWVLTDGRGPDAVFYFDLPPEVSFERRAARALASGETAVDRFEQEDLGFYGRVRQGYVEAAARRGSKSHWIDATQSIEIIQSKLQEIISNI